MLETSDLQNAFEIPENFLAEHDIDPELFDRMNQGETAPHFDHERLEVYRQYDIQSPEVAATPEASVPFMIKRAGERISSERSNYGLAA